MDILNSLSILYIIAICIMIGALIFAYVKRLMMTYALISANIFIFILTIIFPPFYSNSGNSPRLSSSISFFSALIK